MRRLTITNGGWLRKTTTAGMIPLLLAQILVALFCVPETLNAGKSNYLEVAWESLPLILNGEEQVTTGSPAVLFGAMWSRFRTKASIFNASPWPPTDDATRPDRRP